MAAAVLEKQEKRLYADDTVPLVATIAQYRTAGSHVVSYSYETIAQCECQCVCTYCIMLVDWSSAGVRDSCAHASES